MKKIIALLLALIMTFSVATVAFAEGETVEEPKEEESIVTEFEQYLGEYSWILDLPAGVIPPALKLAVMALKFIKVYVKICNVFGLDPIETAKWIFDYVAKIAEENEDLKNLLDKIPTTSEPAEETTAPAVA